MGTCPAPPAGLRCQWLRAHSGGRTPRPGPPPPGGIHLGSLPHTSPFTTLTLLLAELLQFHTLYSLVLNPILLILLVTLLWVAPMNPLQSPEQEPGLLAWSDPHKMQGDSHCLLMWTLCTEGPADPHLVSSWLPGSSWPPAALPAPSLSPQVCLPILPSPTHLPQKRHLKPFTHSSLLPAQDPPLCLLRLCLQTHS